MAIPNPEKEQRSEPSADDIRAELIERVRSDSDQQGHVCDSHYVATVVDGEYEYAVVEGDEGTDEGIDLLEQADAAFVASPIGEQCVTGQFVVDDAQDRDGLHRTLIEGALGDASTKRDRMADHDDVADYTPRERAVLAAGTHASQQRNPLAALLGGL